MPTNYLKKKGDDVTLSLTFKDAEGNAIDITNYTVYFMLKRNKYDADNAAAITKTITSHSDPTHGITAISLSATETAALSGTYYYNIVYKTKATGGVIKTVDSGVFTFETRMPATIT